MAEAITQAVETDPRLISRHSRRQYRSSLLEFETWRDGRLLTKTLVEEYAAALQKQNYAPDSISQKLSAIRWWTRKLIDHAEDQMEDGPEKQADIKRASRVLLVRNVKGARPPRGRYLSPEETKELLDACAADTSPAGVRDAALIAVALSCGLRRDDLTTLRMEDIKGHTGDSCDLVIHGKGNRVDTLYLYNGGYKRLRAWLMLRGSDPGRVFCQVRKNDKINTAGSLGGYALLKILDARQVGLSISEHITWHDFRKTFICTLLDKGQDLSTVQKLARHASPATTSNIYDIRDEKTRRAAVASLEIGE
jgi:integrase